MRFNYPLIIHNEDGYWGEFPDLQGCNPQGETINDIVDDAQKALELHLLSMLMDEEVPNPPSNPTTLSVDKNSFVALIGAEVNPSQESKSTRKNVTIPVWMNRLAEERNINFSQTLQEALIEKLSL